MQGEGGLALHLSQCSRNRDCTGEQNPDTEVTAGICRGLGEGSGVWSWSLDQSYLDLRERGGSSLHLYYIHGDSTGPSYFVLSLTLRDRAEITRLICVRQN